MRVLVARNITPRILIRTALLLLAVTGPVASSNAQGVGYCFGDPGSGTPCPCGDNDGSVPGSGCDNGVFASGAQLTGNGLAWLSSDTLVLHTTHLEPNNAGLYFQADNLVAGGDGSIWGDGLRCAGGSLKRLGVRFSDASGYSDTSSWTTPISTLAGNISPGDIKRYQCWYRTTVNPPCGHGWSDFNSSNGYEVIWLLDGFGDMALVPAGTFDMGDHSGTGYPDELPVHSVYLDAFLMDVFEVSNEEYAEYLNTAYAQGRVTVSSNVVYQVGGAGQALCDTTGSSSDSRITWNGSTFGVTVGKEDHPMLMVSWYGACAYANQRSRDDYLTLCYDETTWACSFTADGYRLPTEAEWEYAARGGEHSPYYMYPWGDAIDGSKANYGNSGDPYEGNNPQTTPVGYYDGNQIPAGVDMANGYGLYDMTGNVWEWCGDWYDGNYYASSPSSNPPGPPSGSARVLRGGGWTNSTVNVRSAKRIHIDPTGLGVVVGFRVLTVRP